MANPDPSPATRFLPGHDQPGPGRPRITNITKSLILLREATEIAGSPLPGDRNAAELIAEVMYTKAIKGHLGYTQEILNRTEGKVPDRIYVDDARKAYDVETDPDDI